MLEKLLRHETTSEKGQEPIFFFFELGVSLIMGRVISVPLSTSERLPHIEGNSIFPCLDTVNVTLVVTYIRTFMLLNQ